MCEIKLANVSNPAAFGVEWTADVCRYQLVNIRGTSSLIFGIAGKEDGRWHTTSVVRPERFGLAGVPANFRAFLAIAQAFVNGT